MNDNNAYMYLQLCWIFLFSNAFQFHDKYILAFYFNLYIHEFFFFFLSNWLIYIKNKIKKKKKSGTLWYERLERGKSIFLFSTVIYFPTSKMILTLFYPLASTYIHSSIYRYVGQWDFRGRFTDDMIKREWTKEKGQLMKKK